MNRPPPSVTTRWMLGRSLAAQRGCWKLFQEPPTMHCPPAAADAVAPLAPAAWLAGAGVDDVPLHAVARTSAAPSKPAVRRFNMCFSSSDDDTTSPRFRTPLLTLPPSILCKRWIRPP